MPWQYCFIAMREHDVKYLRALLTECCNDILNGNLQFSEWKVQFKTSWVGWACARPRGQFTDDPVFLPGGLLAPQWGGWLCLSQRIGHAPQPPGAGGPAPLSCARVSRGPQLPLRSSFTERLQNRGVRDPGSPNLVFLKLWLTRHQQQIQHQQKGVLSDVERNYAQNHQTVHCTPFPPDCAAGHPRLAATRMSSSSSSRSLAAAKERSAPPGFPLEGGTTSLSSPAAGSHFAVALAGTCRFFRLWCPCRAGWKPSNRQRVRSRRREGDGGVVHSHCSKPYFLRELHWKCPSPLFPEALKTPVCLEALNLGYFISIALFGFLCNEL